MNTDSAPAAALTHDTVLVVDFGAQYAQLIARRVRELDVFSEIVNHRITAADVTERAPAAIILSGGPASVNIEGTPRLDPAIYELGIPIFGICYGAQLIATQLGGTVGRGMAGEYGRARLTRVADSSLLPAHLPDEHDVWMSHFDAITVAPSGLHADGEHQGCPCGRARERPPQDLGRSVPPGGRALPVRHAGARTLPPRPRRLPHRLEHERP